MARNGAHSAGSSSEQESAAGVSKAGRNEQLSEAVVGCLQVALSRCRMQTAHQMSMLLQRLSRAAMVPRGAASEEFRHGVVRCLQALLRSLQPCTSAGCLCTATSGGNEPTIVVRTAGCALGLLRGDDAAVAVAEGEVAAGTRGSRALRTDALATLRLLILQVQSADALAFFLPGVASGLTRAMLAPGRDTTRSSVLAGGAVGEVGGSSATTWATVGAAGAASGAQAVLAMADIIVLTLADAFYPPHPPPPGAAAAGSSGKAPVGADGDRASGSGGAAELALTAMRGMAAAAGGVATSKEVTTTSSSSSSGGRLKQQQQRQRQGRVSSDRLRVERNAEWLDATAGRVHALLARSFPLVSAHGRGTVRAAVADAAAALLTHCSGVLAPCAPLLLDCLLTLAHDELSEVATKARRHLAAARVVEAHCTRSRDGGSGGMVVMWPALEKMLHKLVEELPSVVRGGSESAAVAHAQRLASVLRLAGPARVSSSLLLSPAAAGQMASALLQSFEFAAGSSFVMETTTSSGSSTSTSAAATSSLLLPPLFPPPAPAAAAAAAAAAHALGPAGPLQHQHQHQEQQGQEHAGPEARGSGGAHVPADGEELPRMPPRLAHAGSPRAYAALARVCRTLGRLLLRLRLAEEGEPGGVRRRGAASALLEPLLQTLRQLSASLSSSCGDHRQKKQQQQRASSNSSWDTASSGAGADIVRAAASAAVVLNEIVFGASCAAWKRQAGPHPGAGRWCHPPGDVSYGTPILAGEGGVALPLAAERAGKPRVSNDGSAHQNDSGDSEEKQPEAKSSDKVHYSLPHPEGGGWGAEEQQEGEGGAAALAWVESIVAEYSATELWDAGAAAGARGSSSSSMSMRYANDCALLQQMMLEGIGVFARCLGPLFVTHGTLLLSVLHLLLAKLAHPSAPVSRAALAALLSICTFCGYSSVGSLVAGNADYVVDALCRGLRHLDSQPSAPALFVAVLRCTGASSRVLPLLSEPIQAAVNGLQVAARKRNAHHTASFLMALKELAAAACWEAAAGADTCRQAAAAALKAQRREQRRLKRQSAANMRAGRKQRAVQEEVEEEESLTGTPTPEEVREYFLRRLERKKQLDSDSAEVDSDIDDADTSFEDDDDAGGDESQANDTDVAGDSHGSMTAVALIDRAREAQVARLSGMLKLQSVAALCLEACGPLLASRDIRVCMVALDTTQAAMEALAHVDAAKKELKAEAQAVLELVRLKQRQQQQQGAGSENEVHEEEDEGPKPDEKTEDEGNRLLPRVHFVWPYLMPLLRRPEPAVIERALEVVAAVARASGGHFVARRFRDHAWPLMRRLLHEGPPAEHAHGTHSLRPLLTAPAAAERAGRSLLVLDPREETRTSSRSSSMRAAHRDAGTHGRAPSAVLRVRRAVLLCMADVASSPTSAPALQAVTKQAAASITAYLDATYPLLLRESASHALLALGRVDADAVRLPLTEALYGTPTASSSSLGSEHCGGELAGEGALSGVVQLSNAHDGPTSKGGSKSGRLVQQVEQLAAVVCGNDSSDGRVVMLEGSQSLQDHRVVDMAELVTSAVSHPDMAIAAAFPNQNVKLNNNIDRGLAETLLRQLNLLH
eukprot:jgi/Mesen1/8630/ME000050S08046